MSDIVLRRVTMLNDTVGVSVTGEWFGCDYRFAPNQTRTIIGTKHVTDVVFLEGTIDDIDVAVSTVVTLDSYVSVTSFAFTLYGPWSALRIRKTGTNGAAEVKGII